jgi:hypothetical protein
MTFFFDTTTAKILAGVCSVVAVVIAVMQVRAGHSSFSRRPD